MKKPRRIYLDYAAAMPVLPEVIEAMAPYWRERFGNAGAIHQEGVEGKRVLEESRETIVGVMGAHADEIVFTSGGTESNNLAIFGLVEALRKEGRDLADLHFVTSVIEHPSVLDCFKKLERDGASVTYCGVDKDGLTDPKEVRKALAENTVLVSIAYANNEIGTVQPIAEISKIIRAYRKTGAARAPAKAGARWPLFHTDASQAPLWLDCRVEKLGIDLATFDGQKTCGPKGIGFLYARRGVALAPIMHGGSQERGLRPGTPVTPLIVGMTKALKLADERRAKEAERVTVLRDRIISKIVKCIPKAALNGHPTKRLPNNINISFPGIDNEFLVLQLDAKGFAVGTRSACLSDADDRSSYVIEALGAEKDRSKTSIRITLGPGTTKKDIDDFVAMLTDLVVKVG